MENSFYFSNLIPSHWCICWPGFKYTTIELFTVFVCHLLSTKLTKTPKDTYLRFINIVYKLESLIYPNTCGFAGKMLSTRRLYLGGLRTSQHPQHPVNKNWNLFWKQSYIYIIALVIKVSLAWRLFNIIQKITEFIRQSAICYYLLHRALLTRNLWNKMLKTLITWHFLFSQL